MTKELENTSERNHMYPDNIVFFDGYCILCNGFVDFLLKIDGDKVLSFASLQGKTAKTVLPPSYLEQVDTVIFKDSHNSISQKSSAVINILCSLGGPWKIIKYLKFIPNYIRDFVYDFIAENRYKWFGKRDMCRVSNESERERILP